MEIQILLSRIGREVIFWMAWVIIPLIMEIIPAFGGFFILLKKKFTKKPIPNEKFFPEITLIIPVYNSAGTLRACLESVYNSKYNLKMLDVLLINNESKDNSYEVYAKFRAEYKELQMTWLNASQGKAKALNLALFNSHGKYIIHIDSDGILHPSALKNMADRFERDPDTSCLTGAILTDYKQIEQSDGFIMKIIRRCEFYEYCQSFLAGRNFESEFNSVYTLSGAFSAFRKSAILKSKMYNTNTVSEDTQVTFQMRNIQNLKVKLCENAFFFVDPIESCNKLYTQRQRWQRGEIEVSHMFLMEHMNIVKSFFSNFMVRVLMFDHTFAFPRLIWYFALIFLVFLNYPVSLVIGSIGIIYLLYVFSTFLFFINVLMYLDDAKDVKRYYRSKWYIVFILPLFNFIIFWIRFAGIINSTKEESKWKTSTLTEEWKKIKKAVNDDFHLPKRIVNELRRRVNNE
ncbi:MAG: putative glycosyltransferase, exosortase G system-associated [Eubacteriales bacterium]|nr:putative glycosyltransferase, exosortase G system-associated [Eubacteriales bacterium]MDD4630539.1 putative glycosyltransferase, exosortase G system-associated [Eubacteriales bacterium]